MLKNLFGCVLWNLFEKTSMTASKKHHSAEVKKILFLELLFSFIELFVKIAKKQPFQKKCIFVKENSIQMNDEIIISGLTLAQIKSKAQYILETEVIPKAELFEIRKREGRLSKEVNDVLKTQNA